eukprot:scaffold11055_cov32-Tisochrysis_lutea.AAC.1
MVMLRRLSNADRRAPPRGAASTRGRSGRTCEWRAPCRGGGCGRHGPGRTRRAASSASLRLQTPSLPSFLPAAPPMPHCARRAHTRRPRAGRPAPRPPSARDRAPTNNKMLGQLVCLLSACRCKVGVLYSAPSSQFLRPRAELSQPVLRTFVPPAASPATP